MNIDDIIYLSLLIFSIAFGYYYRQIADKNVRKCVGTVVGLILVVVVSGFHALHPILTTFINACIIRFTNKRQCHLISFIFTFLYLAFFRTTTYFGIPYPPPHTNLIQMMLTLKMVGLALEVNNSKSTDLKTSDDAAVDPSFTNIIHYAFNYIGVLTGPYYRYKTFNDSFELPFSVHSNWKTSTFERLKYVPLFAFFFLVASYYWPLSYATSTEFYTNRSWFVRYLSIWPYFFIFRMRIYIGLILSECVCTMAGLGAYPVFTAPKPGQGPSENIEQSLRLVNDDDTVLRSTEYDFETVRNINPYGADFCTTCREGMKHWNICIQYWLAVNVYKRFPSRKWRTIVTLLVSSYWHGVYSGYYVCIGTVPLVLVIEDVYVKLLLRNQQKGLSLILSEWYLWFFKMHFFSYQAIAFLLLDTNKILYFYNSIYHIGLIIGVVLYVVGLVLLKRQKQINKVKYPDKNKNPTGEQSSLLSMSVDKTA